MVSVALGSATRGTNESYALGANRSTKASTRLRENGFSIHLMQEIVPHD